jgi:23S rRNA (uracil1939-C5)-methyltransferase
MVAGDELELVIESVVYRGAGLARHAGCVVFVAGVAPGERVRVRVERLRRNYAEARLLAVVTPSADRIAPCCRLPAAPGARLAPRSAPGCVYDHLSYAAEVAVKQRQLADFLGRLPQSEGAMACLPPVASPMELHYRNKIVLHAARGRADRVPRLGYLAEDNRTVVDVPACPLARAPINAELARFRAAAAFQHLRDGQDVTFRWTVADGVVQWIDRPATDAPWLIEASPIGPLRVSCGGFYQVNPEVAQALVQQVAAWYTEVSAITPDVLDLYCGVGGFGLACAQSGARRVLGIESGRDAIDCARANARALNAAVEFRCQRGLQAASEAFGGFDLATATVIVDPPRDGLEPPVCEALAAGRPPRIIYISCDPATLTRDLKILLPTGYRIVAARLFDLFPRTAHFETAVLLARIDGLTAS